MLVYRLGKSEFARDLSGEGARLHGGRWNHPGTPCIYTSETRALSLLEFSANVSIALLPRSLSFTCIRIPDDAIEEVKLNALPRNWQTNPHTKECRDFGTHLLQNAKHLVLKFPSAMLVEEFNYLINPIHPRIREVSIHSVRGYPYDLRLKK